MATGLYGFDPNPTSGSTPGAVPVPHSQGYENTYADWQASIANSMVANISAGMNAGYPATWDQAKYGNWDRFVGLGMAGGVDGITFSRIYQWINDNPSDPYITQNFGPPPEKTANGWILDPKIAAAQEAAQLNRDAYNLNVRQQDFAEAKFAISMALDQASSSSRFAANGTSSIRGGGGGGGGGGASTAQADQLALDYAKLDLEAELGRGQLDLQKLQLAAQTAYQNAQLDLSRQQMAQQQGQFQASLDFQKQQAQQQNALTMYDLQNKRANTIAGLAANPGDAVQYAYTLRGRPEPLGTPVDAFTGQADTSQQKTLSQLMQEQAPLLAPYATASVGGPGLGVGGATGAPPPAGGTPPPAEPPPPAPTPLPGAAAGTLPGYTTETEFKVGDSLSGRPTGYEEKIVNPTRAPIRVVPMNPAGSLASMMKRYPDGTGSASASDIAAAQDYYAKMAGSTTPAPGSAVPGDPWAAQRDANGVYRGNLDMTPSGVNVYDAPATVIGPTYDLPGLRYANGQPKPFNQFNTQAEAGILTPAQLESGATQSVNPGLPNFKAPEGFPTAPPTAAPIPDYVSKVVGHPVQPQGTSTQGTTNTPANSTVSVDQSDPKAQYRKVLTGGRVHTADGGGAAEIQPGDYEGPPDASGNPTYLRWNAITQRYMPIVWNPTIISSAEQFYKLPQDVQQRILTGKSGGYFMNDAGMNAGVITQMMKARHDAFVNEHGREPTQQEMGAFQNSLMQGLQQGRNYPAGWVSSITDPLGTARPQGVLTEQQFHALPPEQKKALINGEQPTLSGSFNPGSVLTPMKMGPTGSATDYTYKLGETQGTTRPFDYASYLTPEEQFSLFPPPTAEEQMRAKQQADAEAMQRQASIMGTDLGTRISGLPWGSGDKTPPQGWTLLAPNSGERMGLRWALGPDGKVYYSTSQGLMWVAVPPENPTAQQVILASIKGSSDWHKVNSLEPASPGPQDNLQGHATGTDNYDPNAQMTSWANNTPTTTTTSGPDGYQNPNALAFLARQANGPDATGPNTLQSGSGGISTTPTDIPYGSDTQLNYTKPSSNTLPADSNYWNGGNNPTAPIGPMVPEGPGYTGGPLTPGGGTLTLPPLDTGGWDGTTPGASLPGGGTTTTQLTNTVNPNAPAVGVNGGTSGGNTRPQDTGPSSIPTPPTTGGNIPIEGGTTGGTWQVDPANPNRAIWVPNPAPTPAPPPPTGGGTTPPPATGGGTTPPPPATGGGGGTTPPPATGGATGNQPPIPTFNSAQDLIAWLNSPSGINVLSYGNDVMNNLPVLNYLRGSLPENQYMQTSGNPTNIPALGVNLPPPNAGNYQKFLNIKQNDPYAWALMQSYWRAGNRDLDTEMAQALALAPVGSAWQSSLIST